MSSGRRERLCKIFDYLVYKGYFSTRADFAKEIKTNKTNLSSAMNGNEKYLSDSLFSKIHSTYKIFNLQWMLTGRGEMLTITDTNIEDAEIIGEQSNIQCHDTRPLTAEECELCPAKLPYVKGELVQARDVNIRKLVENEAHKLEHRSLRDMIGNPDYVQKVITEAMMPTFQPGDLLFIQFLPENAKLISGAIYLIDTRVYGAMVRQVFVEQDYYILHSKNPEYKELKLKKQDVYSFSLVLHSLRSDFKISKTSPDGAEVFKKREKQLERLLSMHEQALAEIRIQNERMAEERKRQDEERKAERIRQDKLIERILQIGA